VNKKNSAEGTGANSRLILWWNGKDQGKRKSPRVTGGTKGQAKKWKGDRSFNNQRKSEVERQEEGTTKRGMEPYFHGVRPNE